MSIRKPRPSGLTAGININPVEGLKLTKAEQDITRHDAGININPVEGLKQKSLSCSVPFVFAGININPVEGLKPFVGIGLKRWDERRNQHQPSRGIKTCQIVRGATPVTLAGININPVEGLKQATIGECRTGVEPESTSTQSRD